MHGRSAGLGGLSGGVGKEAHARWQALHRRILVVAKHRFARFGFEGVDLEDIAHGADLSMDELQSHFPDKRAVLRAVLDECWESIDLRLEDIVLNALTTRDALISLLALMMNVVENDEDTARLLLSEDRRPDPESGAFGFSEGCLRYQRGCRALVEHGQRHGDINRRLHPQVVSSMLIGAIEGLIRDRLAAGQESSLTPYTGSHLIASFETFVASLRP